MLTRLRDFFQHSITSLKQYPWVYLAVIGIAVLAVMLNHDVRPTDPLVRILYSLILIVPLMITGPLMREIDSSLSRWYAHLGQIIALGLWALFYFLVLSADMDATGSQEIQITFSFVLAWILPLGAIVIATKWEQTLLRWRCKQFIIALVVAGLSAMILWWGIAASIASIEYLFDVVIHSEIYGDIGIIARAIVGVMVWLTRLQTNDEERIYNKLFRFFWLYIFTPLTLVYTVILVAYAVKIIVLRQWPHSGTVWLVGAFVAFSMVGYLLIYPLISQLPRLRKAQTVYCISLIAFSTFLIIAFFKRLEYHGFTVEEYYIALLTVWMIGLSIYTLRDRQRSLSGIILFFLILLWLSLYGPQSSTSLSTRMQYHYFIDLMTKNDFLTEDMHVSPHPVMTEKGVGLTGDLKNIRTVVTYLVFAEDIDFFKHLYIGTGFDQFTRIDEREFADRFMVSLGVDKDVLSLPSYDDNYFNYNSDEIKTPISIVGYTAMMPIDSYTLSMKASVENVDESLITLTIAGKTYMIDIAKHIASVDTSVRMLSSHPEPLKFTTDNYMLILKRVSWQRDTMNNIYKADSYDGFVFVK